MKDQLFHDEAYELYLGHEHNVVRGNTGTTIAGKSVEVPPLDAPLCLPNPAVGQLRRMLYSSWALTTLTPTLPTNL